MSDVAIVGAGPAGVAAAIYLARNDVDAALLERGPVGGLARNANLVEDYPGFPEGISGAELCKRFEGQLASVGVLVIDSDVEKVSRPGPSFVLKTNSGDLESRAVIIATGTRPAPLDVKGADKAGERIFYEVAEMEGFEASPRVAVVGGGEAALDYALSLQGIGCTPQVFCRGAAVKTNPRLMARFQRAKIPLRLNSAVAEIRTSKEALSLSFADGSRHECDRILAALGRVPNLPKLGAGFPEMLTVGDDCQTQVPGVFVAGDARRGRDRHLATAVGDGMRAAMAARKFVEALGGA